MNRRTRELILARDNRQCVLCGTTRNLTLHHVRPKSAGGPGKPPNVVTLCETCHRGIHKLANQVANWFTWGFSTTVVVLARLRARSSTKYTRKQVNQRAGDVLTRQRVQS